MRIFEDLFCMCQGLLDFQMMKLQKVVASSTFFLLCLSSVLYCLTNLLAILNSTMFNHCATLLTIHQEFQFCDLLDYYRNPQCLQSPHQKVEEILFVLLLCLFCFFLLIKFVCSCCSNFSDDSIESWHFA